MNWYYIVAYFGIGLLAALFVNARGKAKRWSQSDIEASTILTLLLWPAWPFVLAVLYACKTFSYLSDRLAEKL